MGEWIRAQNKQIIREPLCDSHDLFVPGSDSFPHEPWKKTLIPWLSDQYQAHVLSYYFHPVSVILVTFALNKSTFF